MWLQRPPWYDTMAGLPHIGMVSPDMMKCLACTCGKGKLDSNLGISKL